MVIENINNLLLTLLTSLSGVVLLTPFFLKLFGNYFIKALIQYQKKHLDQLLESHKVKLRKSEIFFLKEFDTALEYSSFINELVHSDSISENFIIIEKTIDNFLKKNRVLISSEIANILYECLNIIRSRNTDYLIYNDDSRKDAEVVKDLLLKAEDLILDNVRSQVLD